MRGSLLTAQVFATLFFSLGCKAQQPDRLYSGDSGAWSLALLADSTFAIRGTSNFPFQYLTYGRYTEESGHIILRPRYLQNVPVTVRASSTSASTGNKVIEVFDCSGRPVDTRYVGALFRGRELQPQGNRYTIQNIGSSTEHLVLTPHDGSVLIDSIPLHTPGDTLSCFIQLPGFFLTTVRPVLLAPGTYTLSVQPSGLVSDESLLSASRLWMLPERWLPVKKGRDMRTSMKRLRAHPFVGCNP